MAKLRNNALSSAQLSLFDVDEPLPVESRRPGGVADPVALAESPKPVETPAPVDATEPAAFDNPQASHRLMLSGHRVAYALRRSRRRSIGFSIGDTGLSVSAPKWVSVADIERVLVERAGWILRKLQEQRERARLVQAEQIVWRDGAQVPFLGQPVIVVLDPRTTGAVLHTGAQALPGVPHLMLHVGLPHDAAPTQIRDAVQSWLQRQAIRIFDERCREYAPQLGVKVRKLSLSAAQTRWGSASADGSIRLHWRLVHFRLPTIDYVIAHELAHLREMNHSPKFWDVVRSVLPDFEHHRHVLRAERLPGF